MVNDVERIKDCFETVADALGDIRLEAILKRVEDGESGRRMSWLWMVWVCAEL